jgi:hypothetical protein
MNCNSIAVKGIQFYQASLGEWLSDRCRFSPTCSQYAIEACRRFGARKGIKLALADRKRDFWDFCAGDDFWLTYWTVDLAANLMGAGVEASFEGCASGASESSSEVHSFGDSLLDGCQADGCLDGAGCDGCSF